MRLMLLTLATFLLLPIISIDGKAMASVIKAGLASYTDNLPSIFQAPTDTISKTENLTGGLPSNKWYSSLLWQQNSNIIYAHPLAYKFTNSGLEISLPKQTTLIEPDGDTDIIREHNVPDLTVTGTNFSLQSTLLDKVSDWAIDVVMSNSNPDNAQKIKTTIAHGSPFTYFTFNDSNSSQYKNEFSPKIIFPSVPQIFKGEDGTLSYLGVTINGNNYGLFAPTGSTWSGLGTNVIECHLPHGKNYFSVALIPSSADLVSDLTYLKLFAFAFITDTKVKWHYNKEKSKLTSYFKVTTSPKEGTVTETVMALYPHQWRNNRFITPLKLSYPSIRGTMKTIRGNSFKTEYIYHGILPWLPQVITDNAVKTKLLALIDDYTGYGATLNPKYINAGLDWSTGGYDTYWIGKNLGRLINITPIAKSLGRSSAALAYMSAVRSTLEWWFQYEKYDITGNIVQDNFFYYDKNWGTLIGYHPSYSTNTALNDHNFHYGYWINAAAALILNNINPTVIDPNLETPLNANGKAVPASNWGLDGNWGSMVNELVNDIANSDRNNTRYPFLRSFDVYAGHSWASGNCDFSADPRYRFSGNNQESSSEALNAWAGLILWGEATNNKKIRDTGIFLYTTEIEAVNNYWFDLYGDIHDKDNYYNVITGNKTVGTVQVWGGRYANTTWWTEDPIEAHGINLMPITAASLYLATDPDFVQRNYDATYKEWPNYLTQRTKNGWITNKDPNMWQDVMLSYLSLTNPAQAISKWKTEVIPEFGETKAHTFHWMYTMNILGRPDFTVTANTPIYAVFNKNGKKTYVVYNASTTTLDTVTFSDGEEITAIPARTMVTKEI